MNRDAIEPITQSELSRIWLKLTGRDHWISTTATVFSSEWIDLSLDGDCDGRHHVTYSYLVDGVEYGGRFTDLGRKDEDYLKRDETIEIKFDPRRPSKSYYPELRTRRTFFLLWLGIGCGLAILVITIDALVRAGR